MVWARIDDRANSNAKLIALTNAAFRLWACGLIYCQFNLTDGHIPEHAINTFGLRGVKPAKAALELLQSLVPGKGPLWHTEPGGYFVHDYLDWNDSRAEVMGGRKDTNERKQKWKDRHAGTRSESRSGTDESPRVGRVRNTATYTTTPTDTSTSTELSTNQKVQSAPTKALLAHFDAGHVQRFGAKASFKAGKDAKLMAALWRERHGDPVSVEALIDAFFATRDPFMAKAGYSVGVFVSQVPKLVPIVAQRLGTLTPSEHWRDECSRLHEGRCAHAFAHEMRKDQAS